MAKLFYDHLISIHEVLGELDKHKLSHDEKVDIVKTIDTTIHYQVIETILTHLPSDKHQEFIDNFHKKPHDKKHLKYLKEHKEDIEVEIQKKVKKTTREILKDFKSISTKNSLA